MNPNTITTVSSECKPFKPNNLERWLIGKQCFHQGVHSYDAVYKSIRAIGYYLFMGDSSYNMPPMLDDKMRADMILGVVTKFLAWTGEKILELKASILDACRWRKNRTPNESSSRFYKINRKRAEEAKEKILCSCKKLAAELGRNPLVNEIARDTGSNKGTIKKILSPSLDSVQTHNINSTSINSFNISTNSVNRKITETQNPVAAAVQRKEPIDSDSLRALIEASKRQDFTQVKTIYERLHKTEYKEPKRPGGFALLGNILKL